MSYDLFISFREDSYVDVRNLKAFREIAVWSPYGTCGFRGSSRLSQKELTDFIEEQLHLSQDAFKVIKANPGLFVP